MKIINEHIKSDEYKNVYLIYGDEPYLKKQYRDKLKAAIAGDDTMNYTYYEGEKLSVRDIIDMGNTLPFFAERRLIVIQDSGFFKSSNEQLADYIRNIPDYLIIVFVENEVDKRNKVFKAVNEVGYATEMKPQTTSVLEKWIVGLLKAEGKVISKDAADLLLNKTGASMDLIKGELDKLISYCADRQEVTAVDVEAVCTTQTVSRIFDMIAAIASKKQQQALSLYYDLLTLKEPPMRILYLIVRQFNGVLQVKEELAAGKSSGEIARIMGVAPFIVGKYVSQAKNFKTSQLEEALVDCAEAEEAVKTGRLNEKMAVELIIVKYSGKSSRSFCPEGDGSGQQHTERRG